MTVTMSLCCNKAPRINGVYKPLNVRLLDLANDTYKGSTSDQRVLMWIFCFFDGADNCPVCRGGIERMYNWFNKYGLLADPVRGVRIVIEDHPSENMIYMDLGIAKSPVNIFTDGEGKIFDILYEFPDESWLDTYIKPLIQKDTSVL